MLDDMSSARVPSVEVSLNPSVATKHTSFYRSLPRSLFLAGTISSEICRLRHVQRPVSGLAASPSHHCVQSLASTSGCVDMRWHWGQSPIDDGNLPSGRGNVLLCPETTGDSNTHAALSDYVGLCHVGLLGSRSKEKIQKWSNLDWKWVLEYVRMLMICNKYGWFVWVGGVCQRRQEWLLRSTFGCQLGLAMSCKCMSLNTRRLRWVWNGLVRWDLNW